MTKIWQSKKIIEVCVPECHFPGTGLIFTGKIWEISCPKDLGTSSSRYRLSPAIWDWPFPVPSQSWKWNRNSRIWFQDHSRIFRVVEWYGVVPSRPEFFPDFLEQRDQKTVVLSWYHQFGMWPAVSSCSKKISSGMQTTSTGNGTVAEMKAIIKICKQNSGIWGRELERKRGWMECYATH